MSEVVVETPAPAAAAEVAPVEAEKAPEAPPKPKPGEFARKAAAERERVQRANAGKADAERAAKAEAERDALKAKIEEFEARRKGYLQNPVQVLMDAYPGMEPAKAFEIIGEAARNHGKAPVQTETYAIRQELEEMKAQAKAAADAEKAERQKAAQASAKQVEDQFKEQIGTFIEENAETYELIALHEQQATVYEVIEAHYRKTFDKETGKGEILTTKKACELVEAKLEEMVDRTLKTKKVSAKLKPPEPPTPKTLTNDMAQTTFGGAAKTEQERMARAMAVLDKFT